MEPEMIATVTSTTASAPAIKKVVSTVESSQSHARSPLPLPQQAHGGDYFLIVS